MTRTIDPQRAVDELIRLAPEYAKAKAERIYLEEFRKSLKALRMKASQESSIGAQEREAYADPAYKLHLEALRTAVEIEEKARWMMVAAQARLDVWRSQEATARAEGRATA